jgi:hypothetical protein
VVDSDTYPDIIFTAEAIRPPGPGVAVAGTIHAIFTRW